MIFGELLTSINYKENEKKIVGGKNGYGAKLLPSLACLDTDALANVGATRIGTGQYIDCP